MKLIAGSLVAGFFLTVGSVFALSLMGTAGSIAKEVNEEMKHERTNQNEGGEK